MFAGKELGVPKKAKVQLNINYLTISFLCYIFSNGSKLLYSALELCIIFQHLCEFFWSVFHHELSSSITDWTTNTWCSSWLFFPCCGHFLSTEVMVIPSVIRQKAESQNRCFEKTKHAKFSEKKNISYPLIRTRTYTPMCEIYLKLTIQNPELSHWLRSGVFIFNFEQISHIFLLIPLLILNK